MESDAKGRAALLAAVSALGLSLGVTIPSHATADESPKANPKPQSRQIKIDSHQLKIESHQLKYDSAQIKLESRQDKWRSESHQIKGESQQIKIDGSAHAKTAGKTSPQ
jgi:hypothetical protein